MLWLGQGGLVTLIAAFVIAIAGLIYGISAMRRSYARRLDELVLAGQLLDRHFSAAERVIEDPATPEDLKDLVLTFSTGVGRRDIARRVARSIMEDDQPLSLSPNQSAKMQRMGELIRELQRHRPDLVRDMAEMVSSGYVSMMLRWPETEAAAMRIVAQSGPTEPTQVIREQSEKVLAAAPELNGPQLCAAA